MSEDYNILNLDDVNTKLTQSKSHRQRKSTAGDRKIQHVWTDDEINRLIANVKQHCGLWDVASPEYKLSKRDEWRRVVNELEIDGVDANEAKVKWLSLRTTFMVNLAKIRRKKPGKGANDSHTITWKFFKSMLFLENNNVQYSSSSTSTVQLESVVIDRSIGEDLAVPLTSEFSVGNPRKRSRSRTRTPTLTPPPLTSAGSLSSQAITVLNNAVAALHSSDTNSTFCDNLLAELRTLSKSRAQTLRYKISRVMMDFMEANQEPKTISPDQFVNQSTQDVSPESFNTSTVAYSRPIPLRLSEALPIDSNDKELYNLDAIIKSETITFN